MKGKERGRSLNKSGKSGDKGRSKSKIQRKRIEMLLPLWCFRPLEKKLQNMEREEAEAMTVNSNTVSVVILEESVGELLAVTSSYNNRWSLDIY